MASYTPSVKLDNVFTTKLIEILRSQGAIAEIPGFIQILITNKDGTTLQFVDGRVEEDTQEEDTQEEDTQEEKSELKIFDVINHTLIFRSGSCYITTKVGGKLETWKAPHWMCPDH